MNKAKLVTAILLPLAAAAGLMLAGCDPKQMPKWQMPQPPDPDWGPFAKWARDKYRQNHYPDGYDDMPLGSDFNTRDKIAKLNDPDLRGYMEKWMDERDKYLALWREKDDNDPQVKAEKNRREVLLVIIRRRVAELGELGETKLAD